MAGENISMARSPVLLPPLPPTAIQMLAYRYQSHRCKKTFDAGAKNCFRCICKKRFLFENLLFTLSFTREISERIKMNTPGKAHWLSSETKAPAYPA